MSKFDLYEELDEIKVDRRLLLKYSFSYAKKHIPGMLLCLFLIALFTLVQILNPIIIMISVDDLIDTRDREIGIYEEANFSSIEYGGSHYSSLAHRFLKPDSSLRLIKDDKGYFWLDKNATYDDKSEIIEDKHSYYLKNDETISIINRADDGFIKKLNDKNAENLFILAMCFIVLLVLSFILEYAEGFLINVISQRIVQEMRTELFKHVCTFDMTFFEKIPVGKIVTRLTNDINNISMMFSQVILVAIKDLAIIIGVLAIMISINTKLALASLSLLPFLILFALLYRTIMIRVQRRLKKQLGALNAKLSEYITTMDVIQVFKAEDKFLKAFDEENKAYRATAFKMVKTSAFFNPLLMFLNGASLGLLLLAGSYYYRAGLVEIGVVVAFVSYLRMFYMPLLEFSNTFVVLQSALASLERIYKIRETKPEILSPAMPSKLNTIKGKIEFKNVSFAYDKEHRVLDDVSFVINPGETLAIVGHTGSGKTTIISLLYRFYDVMSGEILIDDVPIKELSLEKFRSMMAMVLQDVIVFSSSVKDNISLYDEEMDEETVVEAAKTVNADGFINRLDQGYDHILKEAAGDLSMGEKQLLSFARAISQKPSILILDEASSNIDSETEMLIQDAIEKMASKRTMIVIAHRLSTIKNADKIIVLDKGKIVEMGKHDELMKLNGSYKALHDVALLSGASEL